MEVHLQYIPIVEAAFSMEHMLHAKVEEGGVEDRLKDWIVFWVT